MKRESYLQQLADYIKKNISKGYTAESLRWALINQGYSRTEVNLALIKANEQLAATAPKMKEKPVIKYEVLNEQNNLVAKADNDKKGLWGKFLDFFRSS